MFKQKQTQESYVTKAKEKYENDCMRINSYVAQSSLVQGKDLERLQLKLEKAKMTVVSNERDFLNFTKALQETIAKWEKDWKYYCDGCQDMEEERIEFMKDNIWAYANAVSTVCVADDEVSITIAIQRSKKGVCLKPFSTFYSPARKSVSPSNSSSPNATWRTSYVITERGTKYQSLLGLSVIAHPMRCGRRRRYSHLDMRITTE